MDEERHPTAVRHIDPALTAEAGGQLEEAVELRRRIHGRPETGLDLPRTQEAVLDALDGLGLPLSTGQATTSVLGLLEGDRPGPTTLLRADMDALEMPEDTGLDFASGVDGKMHACGHDAHVAMLVGRGPGPGRPPASCAGRVVLMFQPGEEGDGGARVMIDEGPLTRRPHRPGLRHPHHAQPVRAGRLPGRDHAGVRDEFRITVTGRGGHASMPHDATDPVPVACEIVTALQAMVTRASRRSTRPC